MEGLEQDGCYPDGTMGLGTLNTFDDAGEQERSGGVKEVFDFVVPRNGGHQQEIVC